MPDPGYYLNPRNWGDMASSFLDQRYNDIMAQNAQTSPRSVAGDVLSTAMNIMPAGPRMAVPRGQGIRAYHVSPYDFDRFSMDNIGAGQGAQSYGHGLYFAENPKVSGGPKSQYWNEFADTGKFPNVGDPATDTAVRMLQTVKGDTASAIARLESLQSRLKDRNPGLDGAIELLKSGKPVGPVSYEVNINAKPEQFLDWDRPLPATSSIRDLVQESARKIINGQNAGYPHPANARTALDALDRGTLTGEGAYRAIAQGNATPAVRAPEFLAPSPQRATDSLRDAGIPGIRYLDQGSRGAEGKGTSNYVLFNDSIIDILKKWGLVGAMGGAASSDPARPPAMVQ